VHGGDVERAPAVAADRLLVEGEVDKPFSVMLCVPGPALALLSQRIAEKIEAEKAGGSAASASCER
jgi:hypothetical protein